MLEESERMIKDINDRLGAAVRELRDLVVGFFFLASLVHQFYHLFFMLDPIKS